MSMQEETRDLLSEGTQQNQTRRQEVNEISTQVLSVTDHLTS